MKQKENESNFRPPKDELVCYCFGYSFKDIEDDYSEHQGRSQILEKIMKEKKAGGCECATRNPKGR